MKSKAKWYSSLLSGLILLLAILITACEQATPPPSLTIAVSPSMLIGFNAEEGGPNPSSQILEIQNSGLGTLDWSVTADADWLTLSPTSGSSSGEINNVTVSVNIAGMSPGDYAATITISAPQASNSPQEVSVSLTITPITPTATYSVSIAVSPGAQSGLLGDTLDYTVTVTNTGTAADTYDVSATEEQEWTLTCPSATSEIAPGVSQDIALSLTIPEEAAPQTEDEITIVATSQSDPATSDSTTCTAVVIEVEEKQPTQAWVNVIPASITKSPGDSFTMQLVIDSTIYNLMACHIELSYDSSAFTAGTITEEGLLGTDILVEPGSGVTDGLVKYGLARILGNPAVPVSATFICITFEVSDAASPGSYSLNVEATLLDENNSEIAGVVTNDGLITVQ